MEPNDLHSARRHQEACQQSLDAQRQPPMCTDAYQTNTDHEVKPSHRGICTCLGNPVFSDTPLAKDVDVRCNVDVMSRPYQHPLYQTTSGSTYGRRPNNGNIPTTYFPRDTSFTVGQWGRNYTDAHFTTSLESTYKGL